MAQLLLVVALFFSAISYSQNAVQIQTLDGKTVSVDVAQLMQTLAGLKKKPAAFKGQIVSNSDGTALVKDVSIEVAGKMYAVANTADNLSIICRNSGFKSAIRSFPPKEFSKVFEDELNSHWSLHDANRIYRVMNLDNDGTSRQVKPHYDIPLEARNYWSWTVGSVICRN